MEPFQTVFTVEAMLLQKTIYTITLCLSAKV